MAQEEPAETCPEVPLEIKNFPVQCASAGTDAQRSCGVSLGIFRSCLDAILCPVQNPVLMGGLVASPEMVQGMQTRLIHPKKFHAAASALPSSHRNALSHNLLSFPSLKVPQNAISWPWISLY